MKNKSTSFFIFILLIIAVAFGFNYFKKPFLKNFQEQEIKKQEEIQRLALLTPSPNPKESFFESMTPREKISQILAIPVSVGKELDENTQLQNLSWLKNNNPGFITIFGEEISKELAEKNIAEINKQFEESKLKPIFAVDHEGGEVQRLSGDGFTILPSRKEACEANPNEIKPLFEKSAQELSDIGVNVVLAPVLDLADNHRVLKSRVCGDYVTSMERAQEFILAFSGEQVMPVVKHFPGIGSTNLDLHTSFDEVDLSLEDTQAFKDILDRFPNVGLMTTHVGIKDALEGVPCSLSGACLGKMTSLYPEVLFFTDALEMKSALYVKDAEDGELKLLSEVAKEAIYAGNNVLVFGGGVESSDFDEIIDVLEKEYDDSEEFRKKVDISVAKILLLKME